MAAMNVSTLNYPDLILDFPGHMAVVWCLLKNFSLILSISDTGLIGANLGYYPEDDDIEFDALLV